MSKKVIVFEPNMNGPAHTEINAGLLKIIEKLSSGKSLEFISDEVHLNSLRKKIDLAKWNINKIKVIDYKPKNFLMMELMFLYRSTKILVFSKDIDSIYFLGILPISLNILSIINIFLQRKIIIALHGQMEAFLDNSKIGKTKYYYYLCQYTFNNRDNIRYIVFGESIAKNLDFLIERKKMLIIDQPYMMENIQKENKKIKFPIVIGLIGRADKSKNVIEIFKLLDSLEKEIINGLIQVKIVGRLYVPISDKYKRLVSYYTETISNEALENGIQSLDYALSFTNEEYYRATPSGVLFDCIKWKLPILALKNDYISYYFKRFGNFGELFNNTEEIAKFLKDLISDINEKGNLDLSNYDKTFNIIREELDINNLSEMLGKQL